MLDGWGLIAGMGAIFGLPLLAVGVILWLCEGSWGKERGEMGSIGVLAWGVLLCLPLGVRLLGWVLT
jgi:hypothetical protein